MLPLLFLPAIAAEFTKIFLRMRRFQSWLHPMTAPTMLEYANPGSDETQVAIE